MTREIKKHIEAIENMFDSDFNRNIFPKHIDYIRFPYFKKFEPDLKVSFNFPIVFFTGNNGSGKSSILQAMYGSVENNSISDFWFTTSLDPIQVADLHGNRHCFICGFTTEYTKTKVEILKTRIHRIGKKGKVLPEYWEPSRPIKKYGMNFDHNIADEREASKTRWNLQSRKVYYMDFRYSLSAFDKYFYFGKTDLAKTKQDVIREHSKKLKISFDKNLEQTHYKRKIEAPLTVSETALKEINNILDKNYIEAKILEHNLYDSQKGFAIRYITENLTYSEAFAGSGEIAVVKLVNDLINVESNSLVLLDEPETSLHPRAQRKLLEFILKQIKTKKLQVLISTHSPDMLEGMPSRAINVLYENPAIDKISIHENIHPHNAFVFIGHSNIEKKAIIVEDQLAKMIVDRVLQKSENSELFEVSYSPGGESSIKQENMVVYAKTKDKNKFIIFDGDQKREKFNLKELKNKDENPKRLEDIIFSIVGEKIKFKQDSNFSDEKKVIQYKDYIDFNYTNVYFLPKLIPEDIIWNEEIAKRETEEYGTYNKVLEEEDTKLKFNIVTESMFHSNSSVDQQKTYEYFLEKWINKPSNEYSEILKIIEDIKNK